MRLRSAHLGVRMSLCFLISSPWLGCDAPEGAAPAQSQTVEKRSTLPGLDSPRVPTPPLEPVAGLLAPARTHDDGSPDACELLGAADPAGLLGARLEPARRIYGLCLVEAAGKPEPERSVGLEIRRDPAGVPGNLEQFWEREGAGVEILGSSREQIQELGMLGDYALWFPISGGLQLFTYWQNQNILVLTIRGVETQSALAWARELAGRSVQRAS